MGYTAAMSTMSLFERAEQRRQEGDKTFRVSEVNRAVRLRLESDWRDVWIEGELSNVKRAASGHVYFTLCDSQDPAQLSSVMFRGDVARSRVRLENGALVRVRGTVSLFEPRGSYQCIVRAAVPAGVGDLHAEFERIRKKLEHEGLFARERKRALPRFPRTIGVVTSASGAAMHDVVEVAHGRFPVRIVVADCRVQGQDAPASIVRALQAIQRLDQLDVVLVTRGGGSAEDLWAFNDEQVARVIAGCRVPVVSGVGHEVDTTIADFVADMRAATPSNAAEIAIPDERAVRAEFEGAERALERHMATLLDRRRLRLERLSRAVGDPRGVLGTLRKRFYAADQSLTRSMRGALAHERARLVSLQDRLRERDPRRQLEKNRSRHAELRHRLRASMQPLLTRQMRVVAELEGELHGSIRPMLRERRQALHEVDGRLRRVAPRVVAEKKAQLGRQMASLDALSPLAVLGRGYSIALHGKSGAALTHARDVNPGDPIRVRLHEGGFTATVDSIDDGGDAESGVTKQPTAKKKSPAKKRSPRTPKPSEGDAT